MTPSGEPCAPLRQIDRQHRQHAGDADPLTLFVEVHLCICDSIDSDQRPRELRDLNRSFVRCFTDVYEAFTANQPFPTTCIPPFHQGHLSNSWHGALRDYNRLKPFPPQPITIMLARFAYVHIFQDLACVLANQRRTANPITKDTFDTVTDDIVTCLRRINPETATALPVLVMRFFMPTGKLSSRAARSTMDLFRSLIWRRSTGMMHAPRPTTQPATRPPVP